MTDCITAGFEVVKDMSFFGMIAQFIVEVRLKGGNLHLQVQCGTELTG